MNDKNTGLVSKYHVTRTDGRPMKGPAIVLEWADLNSLPALQTWAATVRAKGFTALANDVEAELMKRVIPRAFSPMTPDTMPEVFAAILAMDPMTKAEMCAKFNVLLDERNYIVSDPRGEDNL